ncbi:MAG: DUF4335 domain-containing protein [Rhizonema sp. PD37]|nr:DUF4335 domain-containing protein [Rhizonema sp. PD37]
MNIQRKYSLPNCTLLLEGLSEATKAAHFQEMRPELSILVNAECYLSGYPQPLTGGREFFESLVRAVSAYAQEFLSNVPNPVAQNSDMELVQFQKVDSNRHRLTVRVENVVQGLESHSSHEKKPIQFDLSTVQLFDLVEAVDQFFADSQTLPELSLRLQPATRRYGSTSQALIKHAIPATVGVSSLAVAAIAIGLIPLPQLRSPQPKTQQQTTTTKSVNSAAPSLPITTPTTNQQLAATPKFSHTSTTQNTDLEALLHSVPEITDASQLRALNRQVYNQINQAWTDRAGLNQDVVYRVGVAADGAIVGYKAVNSVANQLVSKTPLPTQLYNPARSGSNAVEPIAQVRIVFTKRGVLQVSPWRGYTKTPDVTGAKITDPNTVKNLNQKLYETLRKNWQGAPSFARDLKYRVAVNKDGIIADYEPLNQVAFDYFRQTPLPKLFQAIYGSTAAAPNTRQPLAHYQVVFKPSGDLEVSPWQGYR